MNTLTLTGCKYDAQTYVDKFSRIKSDLKKVKKEISDEELCDYILAGLPSSYDGWKDSYQWTLTALGKKDENDIVVLIDHLIKEGNARAARGKKEKSGRDINNNRREGKGQDSGNRGKSSQKKANSNLNCTYEKCQNKRGHTEDKCWTKHPELMPKAIKERLPLKGKTKSETKGFSGFVAADDS